MLLARPKPVPVSILSDGARRLEASTLFERFDAHFYEQTGDRKTVHSALRHRTFNARLSGFRSAFNKRFAARDRHVSCARCARTAPLNGATEKRARFVRQTSQFVAPRVRVC